MKSLLSILLLLSYFQVNADTSVMVGLGKGALEHESFERAGFVGYQFNIGESYFVKPEFGGWIGGNGSSSWVVGMPLGIQVWTPSGFYVHAGVGPSWISSPDLILGGHLQFDSEIAVGVKSNKVSIEFGMKHFSSAGLEMPNLGRDILGIFGGISL